MLDEEAAGKIKYIFHYIKDIKNEENFDKLGGHWNSL